MGGRRRDLRLVCDWDQVAQTLVTGQHSRRVLTAFWSKGAVQCESRCKWGRLLNTLRHTRSIRPRAELLRTIPTRRRPRGRQRQVWVEQLRLRGISFQANSGKFTDWFLANHRTGMLLRVLPPPPIIHLVFLLDFNR